MKAANEIELTASNQAVDLLQSFHGDPRQAALLPYLAGMFDGEGTIRIDKLKACNPGMKKKQSVSPGYAVHVSIGMVDPVIPRLFFARFKVGSLRTERVPGKRPIYRWHVRGNVSAIVVVKELLPYLIVKKDQAVLALELTDNWERPRAKAYGVDPLELQRREDAYLKMRKLNAVGAAATTERVGIREDEATV